MGTKSEESIKQGLSKREALALTRLASRNKSVLTLDDIQEAVDVSYDEAKTIASNLVQKQWLDRLTRGTYLIVPLAAGEAGEYTEHEFVIATALADDLYISYWSALNYHGLTEQVPMTVFAATTERVPERTIHGVTYRFVTVTDAKFFGFTSVAIDAHTVPVATMEKALVDCADHPEHCGSIVALAKAFQAADAALDRGQLTDALIRQGNGAAVKRMVYLADVLDIDVADRDRLEAAFTTGYSRLDPTRGEEGRYSSRYRLLLNVSEEELRTAGEPG